MSLVKVESQGQNGGDIQATSSTANRRPGGLVLRSDRAKQVETQKQSVALKVKEVVEGEVESDKVRVKSAAESGAALAQGEAVVKADAYFQQRAQSDREFSELVARVDDAKAELSKSVATDAVQTTFADLDLSFLG